MKKLFSILVICAVAMSALAHTYTNNSVLSTGNWVKIRVSESGVQSLSYADIRKAGLDPANVRVYGYGGVQLAQPFTTYHTDDLCPVAIFDTGNAILFYANANIGWTYNGTHFTHTRNTYSDYGYYFLSDNAGERHILETVTPELSGTPTDVNTYTHLWLYEKDLVNLVDPSGVAGGGQSFYGENFSEATPSRTFNTKLPQTTNTKLYLNIGVAAKANATSRFTVTVENSNLNGSTTTILLTDFYTMATASNIKGNVNHTVGTSPAIKISFTPGTSGGLGYLDYIELEAECALSFTGEPMLVRSNKNYQSATPVRYTLNTNGQSNIEVWNITDNENHYRVATTLDGNDLQWIGSNRQQIQTYVVLNTNGNKFYTPSIVGNVPNQNLHAITQADLVIITPEAWRTEADQLAALHEAHDGMTTLVVSDQEVYNEFSSGTPDATAYRWLMKMLYDRNGGSTGANRPKHLLLFGDGTFDNRKLLPNSGQNTLLTYQSRNSLNEVKAYATDDYFGFLDDNEGGSEIAGRMDIGVGRLPVNTQTEAAAMVRKITHYMSNATLSNWKQQIVFLADDGDNGMHTQTAENGAERLWNRNKDFVINKIYLDAYQQEVTASGESYPIAKNRFINLLQNGMLYFNYSGHGGYNNITNEGMMSQQDARRLTNTNLAFWMLATCSFAHFDSGRESTAETAVLNENGGAIGVISADRTVYASQNTIFNRNLCDTLFAHRDVFHYEMTLGEAVRCAKNMTGSDENKMAYVLLADPALRMVYPTELHVNTTLRSDTMRAMSVQQLKGEVVTEDGTRADWFQGKVHVTVFDKMQKITTQDNDEKDPNKRKTLTYNDYPNTIYTGECKVDSGRFSLQFMVPKDIRYNYDAGRIVYYAYDTELSAEGIGHDESFIVGGSNPSAVLDTVGPEIMIYLNTPAFIDGGKVDPTPHFYANLHDEHGINTVGSGIGHDLLLVVDEDAKQTYVLNEFYTSNEGSFQDGQVSFKMPAMTNGQHTLRFRAWDMMNNSSTQVLSFTVDDGKSTDIYSVYAYPNPVHVEDDMTLIVNYDRPDDVTDMTLGIYDLSGRCVWQHEQNGTTQITMNLRKEGIGEGIYIYRVGVKTKDENKYATQSGKIIVMK